MNYPFNNYCLSSYVYYFCNNIFSIDNFIKTSNNKLSRVRYLRVCNRQYTLLDIFYVTSLPIHAMIIITAIVNIITVLLPPKIINDYS